MLSEAVEAGEEPFHLCFIDADKDRGLEFGKSLRMSWTKCKMVLVWRCLEFYGYVGICFGAIWMSFGRFSGSCGEHMAGNP